jgi:hypothetical protein
MISQSILGDAMITKKLEKKDYSRARQQAELENEEIAAKEHREEKKIKDLRRWIR